MRLRIEALDNKDTLHQALINVCSALLLVFNVSCFVKITTTRRIGYNMSVDLYVRSDHSVSVVASCAGEQSSLAGACSFAYASPLHAKTGSCSHPCKYLHKCARVIPVGDCCRYHSFCGAALLSNVHGAPGHSSLAFCILL